jgi:hypothetical protein
MSMAALIVANMVAQQNQDVYRPGLFPPLHKEVDSPMIRPPVDPISYPRPAWKPPTIADKARMSRQLNRWNNA